MENTNDVIRNLNESLERSSKEVSSWTAVLGLNSTYQRRLNQASIDELTLDEKLQKGLEKASNKLLSATSGVLSFGQGLTESAGSFTPLTKVVNLGASGVKAIFGNIPIIGTAIKAAADATAQVTNFMIDSYERAYSTFERVSQSGIVTSFSTFEQSAASMGLMFADYERVIAKNSKDLALLGGGAVRGRKMMEDLGSGSMILREQFQKLGIGTAEANEFQLSYLVQQQKNSNGRIKITDDTIAATGEYIKELELLSRITGQTRTSIDQARKERQNNPVYRAMMNVPNLPAGFEKSFSGALDLVSDGRSDIEEGIIAIGAASITGVGSSNANAVKIANIFNAGNKDIYKLMRQLTTGEITQLEYAKQFAEGLKLGTEAMAVQTMVAPNQRPEYQLYVYADNIYKQLANQTQESVNNERTSIDQQMTESETLNAKMAEMRQQMYESGSRLEKISVSSDLVASGMEILAENLNDIMLKAYELSGAELPPTLEAESNLIKARKERIAAEKRLLNVETAQDPESQMFISPLEEQLELARQAEIDAKAARDKVRQNKSNQNNSQTPTSPQTTIQSSTSNSPESASAPSSASTSESSNQTTISKSLPPSSSSPTTPSTNSAPSVRNLRRRNTGKTDEPVIPPEPVIPHGARTGGILSGPKSGYLAELHGDEAVIPQTQSDVSKKSLDNSVSMMTNNSNKVNLNNVYEDVNNKMERLISLLSDQQKSQKKFIESQFS